MTPAEFRADRTAIGWSAAQVATEAGYVRTMGAAWESGRAAVPEPVATRLRLLAEFHRRHPPPRREARTAPPDPLSDEWAAARG